MLSGGEEPALSRLHTVFTNANGGATPPGEAITMIGIRRHSRSGRDTLKGIDSFYLYNQPKMLIQSLSLFSAVETEAERSYVT